MIAKLVDAPIAAEQAPELQNDLGIALAALPAVLALLGTGILIDLPSAGAVAAGAAVTVGFGAFKRVHGSASMAMGLAAIGMCISALVGTLAGQTSWAIIPAVLLWGFCCGLVMVIKTDIGWVGQQCTIVLLVASAFAGSLEQALQRAFLILAGSGLQFFSAGLLLHLFRIAPPRGELIEALRAARHDLLNEITTRSPIFLRALRLAIVLGMAVELWRWFHLPNGYWMAMTVLLLVRPDLRGTFLRASERILGTVVGAVAATGILLVLPESHWYLAAMTAIFAFMTLLLQQGNRFGARSFLYPGSYAVFAACLTAYVVLLLDYGGLNQRGVAQTRVLLTMAGGVLALVVHIPLDGFYRLRTLQPQPTG